MRRLALLSVLFCQLALADGPFPTFAGISAGADDAGVAGTNQAAMTLFDERVSRMHTEPSCIPSRADSNRDLQVMTS